MDLLYESFHPLLTTVLNNKGVGVVRNHQISCHTLSDKATYWQTDKLTKWQADWLADSRRFQFPSRFCELLHSQTGRWWPRRWESHWESRDEPQPLVGYMQILILYIDT